MDYFITALRLMHQRIYGCHNYGSKAVMHSIEAVCHTLPLFPPQLQWTDQDFNSVKYAGIGKVLDKKEKNVGQTYEQYFASIVKLNRYNRMFVPFAMNKLSRILLNILSFYRYGLKWFWNVQIVLDGCKLFWTGANQFKKYFCQISSWLLYQHFEPGL